ncbi:hypothetical protein [Polyangium fumosum]|uniref:Lipoprotein n=1 Tax=Polyangium fumosum TaxID=889272 RepID=A0A4U1JA82_9BACT|nr:hypothetical protein [Polyangium fumosum]TKD03550.1 hypothetical protein E8A74_25455 [Polyangium fumosum]
MKTCHRVGRAILTGFGLSLAAALAFVNGCALEDDEGVFGPPAEPSNVAAAADAMHNAAPVGIWTCHRHLQPRSLVVTPGPLGNNTCSVTATLLPGSSDMYCGEDGCLPCKHLQDLWKCPTT